MKQLIATGIISATLATGAVISIYEEGTDPRYSVIEGQEIVSHKVIVNRDNGTIHVTRPDGTGLYFQDKEQLDLWLSTEIQDETWIEELHGIIKSANEENPGLKDIEKLDVLYSTKNYEILK